MQVDIKYDWRPIAQIYNQSLLNKIATGINIDTIRLAAEYSPLKNFYRDFSLGELLDQLYALLQINYRNEYVYKNIVAQKIAIERHVASQARLITEFRVNQSKADAVILNGTSSVYEIKSEYDDLTRLPGQLNDYKKAFDRIYVVTHKTLVDKLYKSIGSHIGIIVLNEDHQLDTLREAESNLPNIEPLVIFDALREKEYLEILQEVGNFIPQGNRYDWYYQCKERFAGLPKDQVHAGMLKVLKARTKKPEFLDFVSKLPISLTSIGLASELSISQQKRILGRLAEPI